MSIRITTTRMRGMVSGQWARCYPNGAERPDRWHVSWLADRLLTRDQANTALAIAELLAQTPAGKARPTHRNRRHRLLAGWAAELGLTVTEVLTRLEHARPAVGDECPPAGLRHRSGVRPPRE